MRVGRNEPCPCGSGSKYKKCCLDKDTARPPGEAHAQIHELAMIAVLNYAKRPEFEELRHMAKDLFEDDRLEGLSPGERRRIMSVDWGIKVAFCMAFDLPLDRDGTTLGERFLAEDGGKLPAHQREQIERCSRSSLRPYEVQEVHLDAGLRLRDLWFERDVSVSERMATHQVRQWGILAARVVAEGERNVFEGALYPYRADDKALLLSSLVKERARIFRNAPEIDDALFLKRCSPFFHQFWLDRVVFPPRPKIVTAEGDPLIFGEVVFDVLDLPSLEAVLDAHPELNAESDGRWSWVEVDGGFRRSLGHLVVDRDRLRLETTSRERAERGRRLLETAGGSALRHRATSYESIEQARKRSRPVGPQEPPVPAEVAGPILLAFKDNHYRTWPDIPLPALDGRTPRHAARLKTLRPRLIDLLKAMENNEARGAGPGNPGYDFGWMWKELGLKRP